MRHSRGLIATAHWPSFVDEPGVFKPNFNAPDATSTLMKHISILIPKGEVVMGTIEGPHKVFNQINDFLADLGKPPIFDVKLVGLTKDIETYEKVFKVEPELTIHDISATDLIVIPALKGRSEEHTSELQSRLHLV